MAAGSVGFAACGNLAVRQERLHLPPRCFMRGETIEHHMDVERRLDTRVNVPEERDQVLRAVMHRTASEHFAGRDIERREQVERAVPHIVWVRRSGSLA